MLEDILDEPILKISNDKISTEIFENFDGANNLFSPIGLTLILSMIKLAASEKSNIQLEKIIGNEYQLDAMNSIMSFFNNNFSKIINIFLVNKSSMINPEYKIMIKKLGMISNQDFSDPREMIMEINSFIQQKTDNCIKDTLLSSDFQNSSAIMINVVYFNCEWQYGFKISQTKKMQFHKSQTDMVDMMHQINDFKYFENSKIQLIELPYSNKDYVMGIILPKHYVQQTNLEYSANNVPILSSNEIEEFINNLTLETVEIFLPKFIAKRQYYMIPILQKMGIYEPFKLNNDDLNMLAKHVCISNIIHHAYISIDETGLFYNNDSKVANKKMVANHTFIYYVRHVASNNFLMYGDHQC